MRYVIPATKIDKLQTVFSRNAGFDALVDHANRVNGGYVSVVFDSPGKPRTTGKHSQCNAFNGACRIIALCTGESFEKTKFNVKVFAVDQFGYPGEALSGGHLWPKSEADATVEESGLLIDAAHMIMANLGIPFDNNWGVNL